MSGGQAEAQEAGCRIPGGQVGGEFITPSNQKIFLGAFKILTQQLVKSMSRAVPVQDFPWPIVEHRLHTFNLAP